MTGSEALPPDMTPIAPDHEGLVLFATMHFSRTRLGPPLGEPYARIGPPAWLFAIVQPTMVVFEAAVSTTYPELPEKMELEIVKSPAARLVMPGPELSRAMTLFAVPIPDISKEMRLPVFNSNRTLSMYGVKEPVIHVSFPVNVT